MSYFSESGFVFPFLECLDFELAGEAKIEHRCFEIAFEEPQRPRRLGNDSDL